MSMLRVSILGAVAVIALRIAYPEFLVRSIEDRSREEEDVNDNDTAFENPEAEEGASDNRDPFESLRSVPSDAERMATDRPLRPSQPVEEKNDSGPDRGEKALTLEDIEDPEIDLYFAGWCPHS